MNSTNKSHLSDRLNLSLAALKQLLIS